MNAMLGVGEVLGEWGARMSAMGRLHVIDAHRVLLITDLDRVSVSWSVFI